jgi:hypothetical protein
LGEKLIVEGMNGFTLPFSGFFGQFRGRLLTNQVKTVGAQDQLKVFNFRKCPERIRYNNKD